MVKSLSSPTQKRQRIVATLIGSGRIRSQADVVRELKAQGFEVTQATASRDLSDLGALRAKDKDGISRYVLESSLSHFLGGDLVLSVVSSANTVVIRTPPAAAQFIASSLDAAISAQELSTAIGTIAGDDTVLVISKASNGGAALAKKISMMFGKGK
jgi:transcriptional regulator of arginine metabolism